ncbi:hypothetical protein F4861DRAFT_552055 [Xylaria intraflava]|nr:hypothetical protein F4861DRAFT_552055 [Xylaria intraflava]
MAQNFPDPTLNYGGSVFFSCEENTALRRDTLGVPTPSWDELKYWAPFMTPDRRRILNPFNSLRQSETHLGTIKSPKEFWNSVIDIAPPKKWVDRAQVMKYLSQNRPMAKSYESKIWTQARDWLKAALEAGSSRGWADDMTINVPAITSEFWEAVRIIGDSRNGFGTYPRAVREKLAAVGMCWIVVDPRERIIPKCWVSWARKHGFSYKSTVSVVPSGGDRRAVTAAPARQHHHVDTVDRRPSSSSQRAVISNITAPVQTGPHRQAVTANTAAVTPAVVSSSQHHRTTTKPDPGPSKDIKASLLTRVEGNTEQVKPVVPTGTHTETVPVLPVKHKSPVRSNRAEEALRVLRSSTVPPLDQRLEAVSIRQPREEVSRASRLWQDVEANLKALSTHQVRMHNEIVRSTRDFVIRTLRDTIIEGPVEGLINELIAEASAKAREITQRQEDRFTQMESQIEDLQQQLKARLGHPVADIAVQTVGSGLQGETSNTSIEDKNEQMELDEVPILGFGPLPWE